LKVTDSCEFEQNWRYQRDLLAPIATPWFFALTAAWKANGPPKRAVSFS